MREKKSPSSSSCVYEAQASKHIQSVKRVREHFYGFLLSVFSLHKAKLFNGNYLFERRFHCTADSARACPIAMKNVQINISTKKLYSVEYKTETLKENITN
jgi:hypothetical protein